MTKKDKKVIMTMGDSVRIVESDKMNLEVQRLEKGTNNNKEETETWRFKGYATSVVSAMVIIINKDLLVNYDETKDAMGYVRQVEQIHKDIFSMMSGNAW